VTDRARLLLEDVLGSAASLAEVLDRSIPPAVDPGARLRFVGLGSSRFAALTIAAGLRAVGRSATVEYASADPAPVLADEIVFAISSSGRTAETIDVVARSGAGARTVAVTAEPRSPLAAAAASTIALGIGPERAGLATTTYRATLAVLALATGLSTRDELEPVPALVSRVVDSRATWLAPASELLDGAAAIDVIVEAGRLGSAEQAALMLREAPRLRAEAREAGDWLHTAIYTALPGHRIILLGPSPYTDELLRNVVGRGGAGLRIGTAPGRGRTTSVETAVELPVETGAPPIVRALVESVAIDLLAASLWERAGDQVKRA
jgi:glucosamine 6-phosphate synthetase-like amidotransferase/phosphosugar isomerase protein